MSVNKSRRDNNRCAGTNDMRVSHGASTSHSSVPKQQHDESKTKSATETMSTKCNNNTRRRTDREEKKGQRG